MGKAELSFKHRAFLLGSSIVPPVGVLVVIVLLWNRAVSWRDIAIMVAFYVPIGLALSLGFHRLLTHRAFKTHSKIRLAVGVLGTMGAHGPPLIWVAHHRRHHQFADKEGDPHSPHLMAEQGVRGALRGLWHAHSAWRFHTDSESNPVRYAPDILRDRGLMWVSRHYIGITVAGVILPGVVGLALSGSLAGGATALLWGGLVRIFLQHHVVYSVNSLGHFIGPRRFETRDHSRNLALLALPTFGDSWHNNHHAFPAAAHHGMRWWELDPAAAVIKAMEKVGLAWDVVWVPQERQAQRVAQGANARPEPIDMGRRRPARPVEPESESAGEPALSERPQSVEASDQVGALPTGR